MSISLASCNIRESLAEPDHMGHSVEFIKGLDSDLLVLCDAFSIDNTLHGSTRDTLMAAESKIKDEGYSIYKIPYEDGWQHDRNIMMLSRLAITYSHEFIRFRNVVIGQHEDLVVFGAHFDDRDDEKRLAMATSFLLDYGRFGKYRESPTVLAGDLNALDRSDFLVKMLGSLPVSGILQEGNSLVRGKKAASGKVIELLQKNGYKDADIRRRRTYPVNRRYQRIPLFRPDHIFTSTYKNVVASSVQVVKPPRKTNIDHLALKANLSW